MQCRVLQMVFWRSLLILLLVRPHTFQPALHIALGFAAAQAQAPHALGVHAIAGPNLDNSTFSALLQEPSGKRCHSAVRHHPHNCTYIREQCAGYGDGLINYVEQYYCIHTSWHGCMNVLLALWLSLLFIWLGVSASEYFSPNISTLAKLLHLPESLAGVTLLALGNGAPDLSSTYSAVRAGSAALAIGQIVGSAAFITSVVVCATTLAVPIFKVSRLSYLRELCFFVATVGMVAVIVLSERLTQTMAVSMVALYGAYVLTVVITTYYEERCQALALESEAQYAVQLLRDETAESAFLHRRVRGTHRDGNAGEHTSLLWSGDALPTGATAHRRRNTIGGTDTDYEDRDIWDLELLRAGNPSAKALGGFLRQHRKSLLAAAECSDILEEICESQAHTNPEFRITPTHYALLPGGLTDNRSGFVASPQQLHPASSSSVRLHSRSHSRVSSLSRTPSPWKNYTMQPTATDLGATYIPGRTRSQISDVSSINEAETHANAVLPIWRPRLLATDENTSKKTASLPTTFAVRKNVALSPLPHKPSTLEAPATHLHGQLASRLSHTHEPDARSPRSCHHGRGSRSPASAAVEIVLPRCQAHYPAGIPSTDSESPTVPSQTVDPMHPHVSSRYIAYLASCNELLGSTGSRLHAVLYTCIPTLRFWLPSTTVPLKVFIACSALPVLILTLTVPVVVYMSHECDEETRHIHDDDASSAQHIEPTSSTCDCNLDRHEERMFGSMTPVQIQAFSASASASALDLPDVRSLHASPLVSGAVCDQFSNAKGMADFEWAEVVVSYVRSVVSTAFLCGTLYFNGRLPQTSSSSVLFAVGIGIAGVSLFANYMSRISPLRSYWMQFVPCTVGFASGLVWVAMIADEIVSITQALGLIFGMSEEILGLTIVGFGNSLGDLVTNLTLAQMGYPMMALSACFGGPMLCLLLGVGVAACGGMASAGLNNGPFEIPFTSPTILVSTACLLFNSLLFLVSIPRRGYHMTRTVGLVALSVYLVGMVVNIYIEW